MHYRDIRQTVRFTTYIADAALVPALSRLRALAPPFHYSKEGLGSLIPGDFSEPEFSSDAIKRLTTNVLSCYGALYRQGDSVLVNSVRDQGIVH